ncbi:MAG: response regulator [Deltaproteobacteria bacterium]|nr:response regulator [Deltaproteobacteria bacterium]
MGTKACILVVDDEAAMRNLIADYLRKDGHTVDLADGVKAAMGHLEAKRYDILILDKNMPGLDGLGEEGGMDLIRHVRTNLIPSEVIMMTGFATIDTAVEAVRMGAFDYLLKPFSLRELKTKINRLLEYRSFFDRDMAIQIYKAIQAEILGLVERRSRLTDEEIDRSLMALNEQIDRFFKLLKDLELSLLVQREALAGIAGYAEQLRDHLDESDPFRSLLDEVCRYSNRRI